jgi:hypothetical protein
MTLPRLVVTAAFAAAVAAVPLPAIAQVDAPRHTIKEAEPRTGSHLRRAAVRSPVLPLNRGYRELTPEQREHFKLNYEPMAPDDEPPFPVNGLQAIYDPLYRANNKLGIPGDIFLIATVDPQGKVSQVQAVESPDRQLTRVVSAILFATPFKPAACGGEPCQMDFPLRLQFRFARSP